MNAYCFVADLLGFSNLILNLPPDRQAVRVKQWVDLVKDSAYDADVSQYQLISDTVFASAEPNAVGLLKLITMAQHLLLRGTKQYLPIRGAIAYGDVNWDNEVTYGQAIVDAYQQANNQNWIGVTIKHSGVDMNSLWNWDRLVCYPAPMKSGPITIFPSVAWDIPKYSEFSLSLIGEGLLKGGEIITWDWANKLQSTILFGIYLRALRPHREHLNPEQFQGTLPVEMLDHLSFGQLYMQLQGDGGPVRRITLGCPPGSDCSYRDIPEQSLS